MILIFRKVRIISPLIDSDTTKYLFTFFSLITLKNININFVTESFNPKRIKDEDKRNSALLKIQNIDEQFMKKYYDDKPLFNIFTIRFHLICSKY